jgi:hypothetical protein
MKSGYFARAAYRAFTTAKNGPTLYDLCDPLLAGAGEGNAHLRTFYKKALANPALRLLLSRAGMPQFARRSALSGAARRASRRARRGIARLDRHRQASGRADR